ncbi:MAG: ATP-binding cassette domain-containing protein [Oligoflexia bacterium]|nr:ATP-binding cassette domain-containing protein [Oligoflexia bacterium]
MIKLQNVYKSFSTQSVLTNLSLEVPKASATALLGLSGSGKTTVLKLICGLTKLDQGKFTWAQIKLKVQI